MYHNVLKKMVSKVLDGRIRWRDVHIKACNGAYETHPRCPGRGRGLLGGGEHVDH
jgi:hypothetical protein